MAENKLQMVVKNMSFDVTLHPACRNYSESVKPKYSNRSCFTQQKLCTEKEAAQLSAHLPECNSKAGAALEKKMADIDK